jgi:hypothetical protein
MSYEKSQINYDNMEHPSYWDVEPTKEETQIAITQAESEMAACENDEQFDVLANICHGTFSEIIHEVLQNRISDIDLNLRIKKMIGEAKKDVLEVRVINILEGK